jgi:hypothetical protein
MYFRCADLILSLKSVIQVFPDSVYSDPSSVIEDVLEARAKRFTIVHILEIPDNIVDCCHASLTLHGIHLQNLMTLGTFED